MTLLPRDQKDLALAPVAAAIDANLKRLRDKSSSDIEFELQLELGRPPTADDAAERSGRVLAVALRDVDLHGWHATVTADGAAVRLAGGSVSLDIALGAAVERFIAGLVSA